VSTLDADGHGVSKVLRPALLVELRLRLSLGPSVPLLRSHGSQCEYLAVQDTVRLDLCAVLGLWQVGGLASRFNVVKFRLVKAAGGSFLH
jgi:hypothetical protein